MTAAREHNRGTPNQHGTEFRGKIASWLINRGGPIREIASIAELDPQRVARMGTKPGEPSSPLQVDGNEGGGVSVTNQLTIVFARELIQTGIVGPEQPDSHWNNLQTRLQKPGAPPLDFAAQIAVEAYAKARSDEKSGDPSARQTYDEIATTLGVRRITAPEVRAGEKLIDSAPRVLWSNDNIRATVADERDGSSGEVPLSQTSALGPVKDKQVARLVKDYLGLENTKIEERTAIAGDILSIIGPYVKRYCRARLSGQDHTKFSADDITQVVLLTVLEELPTFKQQGRPLMAWVYGIASHKVIDAHRAKSREKSEPVAEVPDRLLEDSPEEKTLVAEYKEYVKKLLDILPENHQAILDLRFNGFSVEETAEAVGSTPGAVRVTQHRALERLRRKLSDKPGEDKAGSVQRYNIVGDRARRRG